MTSPGEAAGRLSASLASHLAPSKRHRDSAVSRPHQSLFSRTSRGFSWSLRVLEDAAASRRNFAPVDVPACIDDPTRIRR